MNFLGKSLSNIFIYSFGLIIVNGLSFLMLPFYTWQFAPEQYALITLIFICLPFTRYSVSLEICQAAPVFSVDDPHNKINYISIGLWSTFFFNLLFYLSIYICNYYLNFISLTIHEILILFLLFMMDSLFYYVSNILRWEIKPFSYNFILSFVAIFEVILVFTFVLYYQFSIYGVFIAWLISRVMGFISVIYLTRKYYLFTFKLILFKKMIKFSSPLMISNLVYHLNRGIDRWIIASFLGLSAVGIYGAGATIGGIINFVLTTFSTALTPLIYHHHEKPNAPFEIVKLLNSFLVICTFLAILFALFNKDLLFLLVSDRYYDYLSKFPIVQFTVLTSIFSGLHIFFPGIVIKKKTYLVLIFNCVSLLVNAIIAYFLVSRWGITGVAMATLLSIMWTSIMYMRFGQRYYKLPIAESHFFHFCLFFIVAYGIAIHLGLQANTFEMRNILMRFSYLLTVLIITFSLFFKANKALTRQKNELGYEQQ